MTYTVYPNNIDSSDQLPIAVDNVTPVRGEVVNRHREAILAIESELGIQPSGTYTTVRARLDALELGFGGLESSFATLTLAGTLALGNTTSGHNIIISTGDFIVNEAGTVSIGNNLTSQAISFPELAANPLAVTPGYGTLWLKNTNVLVYTDDSGADHDLLTGAETLSATLALGNTTGGTDIILTSGDEILGQAGVGAGSGGPVGITGGTGGSTGTGGNLLFSGGSGGSVSGNGGSITLQGGFVTDGDGGSIYIVGRNGAGSDNAGGDITFTAGNSTGTIDGANITLTPGISTGTGADGKIIFDGYADANYNSIINLPSPINTGDATNKAYVDGKIAAANEVVFKLSGAYGYLSVPAYIDTSYPVLVNKTLASATIMRRVAGTAGTTRVDILKNGVSIFALDANKPQVTAASGDYARNSSTTFNDTSFSGGDYIDIQIDSTETYLAGPPEGPEGIAVILQFE